MAATSALSPSPQIACVTILVAFIVYDIVRGHFLNLIPKLRTAWSAYRTWQLLLGFLIGAIPIGLAYAWQFSMKM